MHVVIVTTVVVGCEHIAPMIAAQSECASVTLLVVLGVAAVDVERPRLLVALGDDVDDTTRSVAAV